MKVLISIGIAAVVLGVSLAALPRPRMERDTLRPRPTPMSSRAHPEEVYRVEHEVPALFV